MNINNYIEGGITIILLHAHTTLFHLFSLATMASYSAVNGQAIGASPRVDSVGELERNGVSRVRGGPIRYESRFAAT